MSFVDRFAHPWILLFLVVPLLIVAHGGRGRGLTLPFDHRLHREHPWLRRMLRVSTAMPAALLTLAIVMLARPQAVQPARAERAVTNIQILLDVSGSMGHRGRYQIASEAIETFTRAREGDAMGLTLFGTNQARWVPITKDLQAVRNALPFANPEIQPEEMRGTAIGAALRYVCRNMETEATEGDRLIVLVSDGESSDVQEGNQYEIAKVLNEARCVLYDIHVAEDSPMVPEVAELARLTGGEGLTAADRQSLAAVFQHIDRMQPAKFIPQGTVTSDNLSGFALAALSLAVLHVIGLLSLRYTPW